MQAGNLALLRQHARCAGGDGLECRERRFLVGGRSDGEDIRVDVRLHACNLERRRQHADSLLEPERSADAEHGPQRTMIPADQNDSQRGKLRRTMFARLQQNVEAFGWMEPSDEEHNRIRRLDADRMTELSARGAVA